MSGRRPTRYRAGETARLTAVQLADYVHAPPARRARILQDAKFPPASAGARYDGAREAIVAYLRERERPPAILADSIAALHARAAATVSAATRRDCLRSAAAVDRFRAACAQGRLGLDGVDIGAAAPQSVLIMGGTQVIAALDGVARQRGEETPAAGRMGGVILVFADDASSDHSRRARCRTIAVLAHALIARAAPGPGEPDPQLSIAIDVLAGLSCVAGDGWQAEAARIDAMGGEIAAQWARVAAPDEL